MNDAKQLIKAAKEFLIQAYTEMELPGLEERIVQVQEEIRESGTYLHLPHELEHGARMAWRNSNRCIGRLFWKSLVVRDHRMASNPDEVTRALYEHLRLATNDGKIIPMITIFAPEQPDGNVPIRIWNKHLIRYACYTEKDGSLTGDPAQKEFTQYCLQIGWKGSGNAFDLLPVVVQCKNDQPQWYPLTQEWIKEVELEHPEHGWFKTLNLRWHALPLISDMVLEIGGIRYPAAPFNGWYMVTEIGSRNLGDETRYNMLPVIAKKMGLPTDKADPFWKDKALVVLNEAVYHSFKKNGVTLTDHHSASDQFMKFMRNEAQCQRNVTGDWSWLVPPMSGSSMEVFHKEYDNRILSPNFFYNTTDVLAGSINH
jgi:nitric-oxide synthase